MNIKKTNVQLISDSEAVVTADFEGFNGYIDEIIIAPDYANNVSCDVQVVAVKASDMPDTVDDVVLLSLDAVDDNIVKRPRYVVHSSNGTALTDQYQKYTVLGETVRVSLLTSNSSGEVFNVQIKYAKS